MSKLTNIKHYRRDFVKALYGKLGKESGLRPGVAWPRKEELEHLKQYEKAFCRPLDDLIADNEAKKNQVILDRRKREEEVYNNLKKLPQEFEQFFQKLREKEELKQEMMKKREAAIEDAREALGRSPPVPEK